jgi:hypothetical protein
MTMRHYAVVEARMQGALKHTAAFESSGLFPRCGPQCIGVANVALDLVALLTAQSASSLP